MANVEIEQGLCREGSRGLLANPIPKMANG